MTRKFKVFISGQKYFGREILSLCIRKGYEVVGVCCPLDDKYIGRLARLHNIPILPAGMLTYDTMPSGVDLGITIHSFDYIGKRTRYKTRLGWIGYHPSLLPRHRGRSAIEWAIRMRDIVTGGSVYWLNSGIDRGDILCQDWCWISPKLYAKSPKEAAKELWQKELLPMGIRLMDKALAEVASGKITKIPQRKDVDTFEPSTEVKDIYKPDLLMLPRAGA